MKPVFQIEPHTRVDKSFTIKGPGDLLMTVDYDDVDHAQVDEDVVAMVVILNSLAPEGLA